MNFAPGYGCNAGVIWLEQVLAVIGYTSPRRMRGGGVDKTPVSVQVAKDSLQSRVIHCFDPFGGAPLPQGGLHHDDASSTLSPRSDALKSGRSLVMAWCSTHKRCSDPASSSFSGENPWTQGTKVAQCSYALLRTREPGSACPPVGGEHLKDLQQKVRVNGSST